MCRTPSANIAHYTGIVVIIVDQLHNSHSHIFAKFISAQSWSLESAMGRVNMLVLLIVPVQLAFLAKTRSTANIRPVRQTRTARSSNYCRSDVDNQQTTSTNYQHQQA